jgi:alpha-glucosidase
MKFRVDHREKNTLVVSLAGEVVSGKNLVTPWRYIMLGTSPTEILQNNYLLENLNEANRIEDLSWIRPGKVIREVTLTTTGGKACVDFAVKHNLQFVEFDAGWYGSENDETSDASTITVDPKRSPGPLDLHEVIKYADSKGIGIILYVNRRALEKQLDEILPLYKSWGIAGVKYGFVQVGSQEWTSWLHEAVRKAAENNLMVDIHDEYRPTGYSRTYPNLMTQEGIRGDEESPANDMVIKTIFTRMIAGAGDHTNCYFADRVSETMGSHASQMAKSICIYSPWQFLFWYDRPAGSPGKKGGAGGAEGSIPELDELGFYSRLPTVWEKSLVLEGYPGNHVVIARKSEEEWFVGALSGKDGIQFKIGLDFLDRDKTYKATIYSDDANLGSRTQVKIESLKVDHQTIISRELLAQNGLALIISPES